MFMQLNVPILGVVENMSYLVLPDGTQMDIFGRGGGERLAQKTQVPFIGCIPMETGVRMGGDLGIPIVISNPESTAAIAMRNIASDVAAKLSIASLTKSSIEINISE
jgi:ATP-binding protein involved in chromosome partitioning